LEKEEAATVANSKGVNNDWTTNKGCHFFLLDSAAFVEKGKKTKEGTRPWRRTSYCNGGTLCCVYKQGIKQRETTG